MAPARQSNSPKSKFVCGVTKFCFKSFNSEKKLEDHVLKAHRNTKFVQDYLNEVYLSQFKSESLRLQTYSNWSHEHIKPEDLAHAGFIYRGNEDQVECVFCLGILDGWEDDDLPLTEHKKSFPKCPFIQGFNVGNIPKRRYKPGLV